VNDGDFRSALEGYLRAATSAASVATRDLRRLTGGAIQDNWAWDVRVDGGDMAGDHDLVVRTDRASGVAESLTRAEEFALLKAACDAGVTVPEPLFLSPGDSPTGRPFYIMRRVAGTAAGHRLVKEDVLRGRDDVLATRMGEELGRIHSIRPPRSDLGFLETPTPDPAAFAVARFQRYLDALPEVYPALQWGLSWAAAQAPGAPGDGLVLTHHDYRTGNYMVDDGELTGILDWEFAGWSDRHEDLGWFCAKCWRFGANDREAGGIGSRAAFYEGYRRVTSAEIVQERVFFWEVMAHIRWAVIAVQQAWRHLSGEEPNLELALTGRIVPELELEILLMTEQHDEGRAA